MPFCHIKKTAFFKMFLSFLGMGAMIGCASPVFAADANFPTVGQISPSTAATGVSTSFGAVYADDIGVVQCALLEDGQLRWTSGMFASPRTSGSISVTDALSQGTHVLQMKCADAAGNWGVGPSTNVSVGVAPTDTHYPYVGMIQQTSATTGVATVLTAPVSDATGVTQCTLIVNSTQIGNMTINGGIASYSYAFANAGLYNVAVTCWNAAGNAGTSSFQTVSVSGSSQGNGLPGAGSLITLMCPDQAAADHPCHAVYYYGTDGKRHAFPNEQVFRSWYADFSGVLTVSDIFMANIPLGKNVTYRPGVRMVKFTTDPKVYAVGRRGLLRWVTSESIASAIYGQIWNRMIDDIPDTFYSNYQFGAEITNANNFIPANEQSNVPSIDANF